jgi:hypothetical protein
MYERSQRHSIQCYHPETPRKKKIKISLSTGKVMITAFRDFGGVIIGDALPKRETINPDAYIRTLKELRKRFKPVRSHTNPTYILRQPVPTGGENEAGTNYRGQNMLHIYPFRLCWEERGSQNFFLHRGPNHFSAALASA